MELTSSAMRYASRYYLTQFGMYSKIFKFCLWAKTKRKMIVTWENCAIVSVWWQFKVYVSKSLKIFPVALVALFL